MPRTFLAAFLLLCSCWLSAGDSGDAPKVAVLRLFDSINASKSYQAKMEVFKRDRAAIEAKAKEFEEQIQKLTTSLEALPANNEKLGGLQEELESTKARREAYVRRQSQELERKQILMLREVYHDTSLRLAEFCKGRGIKIVVQAAERELGASSMLMMNMRIEMQTALFFDADQDITDAFIGFLNNPPAPAATSAPAPTPAPAGK